MTRKIFAAVLLMLAVTLPAQSDPFGPSETLLPSAPVGWVITPGTVAPTATSLSFSPDGSILYVATTGGVWAYPVVAGLIAAPPSQFLTGMNQPLGVLATSYGVFVADAVAGAGIVYRAQDTNGDLVADATETVISHLPNGRHNTNGMALGPDQMLYITNGNRTDSGFPGEGGDFEVQPYSGSVLRVDPESTDLLPDPSMVVATGFRNIYDIAFFPGTSVAAVPMNGPDGQTYGAVTRPLGEDTLSIFDTGDGVVEHFGFPWCLYDRAKGGLSGFTQDPSEGLCSPLPAKAFTGLVGPAAQAFPAAGFGMNVSADGLAFDPANGDLYVTEWGNLYGTTLQGHKIVRVTFDTARNVTAVENFMTEIVPLDVTFAPDGSMWVADYTGLILRLQHVA